MNKVEVAVLKPWIARKVVELLGFEDDVLIEYINSILEDDSNKIIDAKKMQLNLTGFMEKKTPVFMNQLWNMLLSAQANPLKVPTELLEEKKREMREREQQKAIEQRKEDHIQEVRQRERQERNASRFDDNRAGSSRGRGGGGPYRGRGGGQSGRGRPNYRNDDRRDYRVRRVSSPSRCRSVDGQRRTARLPREGDTLAHGHLVAVPILVVDLHAHRVLPGVPLDATHAPFLVRGPLHLGVDVARLTRGRLRLRHEDRETEVTRGDARHRVRGRHLPLVAVTIHVRPLPNEGREHQT